MQVFSVSQAEVNTADLLALYGAHRGALDPATYIGMQMSIVHGCHLRRRRGGLPPARDGTAGSVPGQGGANPGASCDPTCPRRRLLGEENAN